MNFKIIFFLLCLSILGSCGLKTTPRASSKYDLPSIQDQYIKTFKKNKKKEEKEKKK